LIFYQKKKYFQKKLNFRKIIKIISVSSIVIRTESQIEGGRTKKLLKKYQNSILCVRWWNATIHKDIWTDLFTGWWLIYLAHGDHKKRVSMCEFSGKVVKFCDIKTLIPSSFCRGKIWMNAQATTNTLKFLKSTSFLMVASWQINF
jgi:hypothetical protein